MSIHTPNPAAVAKAHQARIDAEARAKQIARNAPRLAWTSSVEANAEREARRAAKEA